MCECATIDDDTTRLPSPPQITVHTYLERVAHGLGLEERAKHDRVCSVRLLCTQLLDELDQLDNVDLDAVCSPALYCMQRRTESTIYYFHGRTCNCRQTHARHNNEAVALSGQRYFSQQ